MTFRIIEVIILVFLIEVLETVGTCEFDALAVSLCMHLKVHWVRYQVIDLNSTIKWARDLEFRRLFPVVLMSLFESKRFTTSLQLALEFSAIQELYYGFVDLRTLEFLLADWTHRFV